MSWVVKANLLAAAVNGTVVALICLFGTPGTLTAVNVGLTGLNLVVAVLFWERR